MADYDLQERQKTFNEPENWLPNSPDLNPVHYSVFFGGGGIATDGVSSHNTISDTDQLKRMLIDR